MRFVVASPRRDDCCAAFVYAHSFARTKCSLRAHFARAKRASKLADLQRRLLFAAVFAAEADQSPKCLEPEDRLDVPAVETRRESRIVSHRGGRSHVHY